MDANITNSIISATIPTIAAGLVLAIFKAKISQIFEDAKENSSLKFGALTEKFGAVEEKLNNLSDNMQQVNVKLAVIVLEQAHTKESLDHLKEDVDRKGGLRSNA